MGWLMLGQGWTSSDTKILVQSCTPQDIVLCTFWLAPGTLDELTVTGVCLCASPPCPTNTHISKGAVQTEGAHWMGWAFFLMMVCHIKNAKKEQV